LEKELAIPFITPDPANRPQLQTGLLFAISITITWLPGTIQHIQELRLEDSPFAVKAATGALLPLHGLWTAVIFIVTSWTVIRECVDGRGHRQTATGIGDLLKEPVLEFKGKNLLRMAQDNTTSGGRKMGVWMRWANRDSQRSSTWDFRDVGIPGAMASRQASRRSRSSPLRPSQG
jgi:hypothetical protein